MDSALDLAVVTRHNHFVGVFGGCSLSMVNGDRDVRCPQEHLRAVVAVEPGVAPTFFLCENVKRGEELLVSLSGARPDDDHAPADLLTLDTAEQETRVVTSLREIELLLEGLQSGYDSLDGDIFVSNKLNFFTLFEDPAFNTTSSDSPTSRDGEDIYGILAQTFERKAIYIRDV